MCLYPRTIKVRQKNKKFFDDEFNVFYGEYGYDPTSLEAPFNEFVIKVPCGKCIECARQISNEWAFRICDEASKYKKNCCITLTYNDEHLPSGGLLVKRDYQLFLKRFRKAISPNTIRYFLSGEYGEKSARPHYHCIMFNFYPDDCVFKFRRNGRDFYTSEFVSDIWQNGHILVGPLDMHTAFYTAKYLQKAIDFGKEVKPFVAMSRRPGIGGDVNPRQLYTDKLYVDGRFIKLPRFYLDRFVKAGFEVEVDEIRRKRKNSALFHEELFLANLEQNLDDLYLRRARATSLFKSFYRKRDAEANIFVITP